MRRFLRNILARRLMRRRIADEIERSLEDLGNKHCFDVNGQRIKTPDGEDMFFSATKIDAAILRLNTLMKSLRS